MSLYLFFMLYQYLEYDLIHDVSIGSSCEASIGLNVQALKTLAVPKTAEVCVLVPWHHTVLKSNFVG